MDTRNFFLLKILDWVQMSRKDRDLFFTKRKIINHIKRVLCCCIVQSLGHVWLFLTQWTAVQQASLSITVSQSLLKLVSIESMMPSNHPHLLFPPSPSTLNLSQHHGLFQWVSSSHQVAKVLDLQHHSFQWIFRVDFLDWLISLLSKGLSNVFSSTTGYYTTPIFKSFFTMMV